MTTLADHQFFSIINESFHSVLQEYKFTIREETKDLVIAQRDNVQLIFRLERAYLAYYFSLEIELSGELGKKATSDPADRHLGVSAIAKCLDPNYDRPVRKATNYRAEEDLREIVEGHKEDLLKYCGSILSGDVSSWQKVVDCLNNRKRVKR